MKKLLIFSFIVLLFCHFVMGQDPSFSQFYFNKIYFNPAFAGITPGIELNLTHRNLWVGIPKGPLNFTTDKVSLSWDVIKNIGVAGILTNDIEGEKSAWELPPLRTTTSGFQISAGTNINKNSLIRGGLGLSTCWKKISWEDFVFSDQLDPVDGKIYNTSSFISPTAKYSHLTYIKITPGLILKYSFNNKWSILSGVAYHQHIQKNSFLTQSPLVPDKWVVNLNIEIPTEQFKIAPVFIWERQKPMSTVFLGTNFFNNYNPFFYGFAYRRLRNSDALAFCGGFQGFLSSESNHKYSFYLSYDLPVGSTKSPGLGTLGAVEINLSLLFNNTRKPGELVCPDWKINLNESYGIHKTHKKIRGGSAEQKKNRKAINKRRKHYTR